jgi:putative tricarboxylic transport membrane protein
MQRTPRNNGIVAKERIIRSNLKVAKEPRQGWNPDTLRGIMRPTRASLAAAAGIKIPGIRIEEVDMLCVRYVPGLLALLMAAGVSHAQQSDWKPDRNVELIVGAAAAGANDRIGRAIQNALQSNRLIPGSMSVVNKPGGGQTIAMSYLNSHAGNAHFLALASSSWLTTLAAGTGEVTHRDVTPIARLFTEYQVYYAKADSPLRSMAEVRDRLKKDPAAVSFGFSVAPGSPLHISIADVAAAAGQDPKRVRTVVFDSGTKAAAAVAGGHLDVGLSSPGSPMGLVQGGKVRYIGVAGPQRIPGPLAEVPTLREQGLDVLTPVSFVVLAPKGISAAQAAYWDGALSRMMQTAEIKRDIEVNLWIVDLMGYRELPASLESQFARYRQRLTEMGLAK